MVERGPGYNPEQSRSPEKKWEPNFGVIVVSGKPGAGTTSLAKRLAAECGASLYKAGDTVRELTGSLNRAPGFILREEEIDRRVDERVARVVRGASTERPFVAEAQIGAATTLQTQKNAEGRNRPIQAPVLRILIWARADVRYRRLYEAARQRGEDVTLQEIQQSTSQREKGDLQHWKSMYSWIGDDNPLEKGARDAGGNRIYDIEFDNSNQTSPEETFNEVIITLRRLGLVRPIGQLPTGK